MKRRQEQTLVYFVKLMVTRCLGSGTVLKNKIAQIKFENELTQKIFFLTCSRYEFKVINISEFRKILIFWREKFIHLELKMIKFGSKGTPFEPFLVPLRPPNVSFPSNLGEFFLLSPKIPSQASHPKWPARGEIFSPLAKVSVLLFSAKHKHFLCLNSGEWEPLAVQILEKEVGKLKPKF